MWKCGHACVKNGRPLLRGFVGKTETVEGVLLTGTGDYSTCLRDMRAQLAQLQREDGSKLRMPPELEGRSFLGMALLYHLTHFLSDAFPGRLGQFPRSPISEFAAASAEVCGWSWETLVERLDGKDPNTPTDRLPGRCFDGALVEALLSDSGGDEGGGGGGETGGGRGEGEGKGEGGAAAAAAGAAGGGGNKGAGGGVGGGVGNKQSSGSSGFGFARESTLISFVEDINGSEVEWTMGAAMSLLHPAAARAARVDDDAVDVGAFHSHHG